MVGIKYRPRSGGEGHVGDDIGPVVLEEIRRLRNSLLAVSDRGTGLLPGSNERQLPRFLQSGMKWSEARKECRETIGRETDRLLRLMTRINTQASSGPFSQAEKPRNALKYNIKG